ncbi:hypothetical protein GCM10018793_54080 [Streptomyces sulfonofaciens]|uniref:Uncharacterized protein n=1 Tax=Streptomyces sulfonofaciens TaxID=68272 RepID=A0A919GIX3_9ACTN|nr:hypothetical protein [Streptomyces sulfonofaciens]GHH85568.1 hypothetical protein GCM10018793_54080 [Streptomyces sulfonofaciens]
MAHGERACDADCGRTEALDDLHEAGPDVWLCDGCRNDRQYDELIPQRRPPADDRPTPPLGDPGEAGRSDAA